MKFRRLMFAATLALATVPAVSGSALAAPENGAEVVNQYYCNPTPFPGVACFDLNYVVNTTETPSGNVSFVTNGRNTITHNTANGCTFTGQTEFHGHYLLKDGELHERGDREESSLTVDCFGRHTICTFTLQAHHVDGTFQYNNSDFICEDA